MLVSAVTGYGFRLDIKRRCEALEELRQICIKLKSEISFRAPPITLLMEKHSVCGECASLFRAVTENMQQGYSMAWKQAAKKWSSDEGLTGEETETVMMLQSLGSTDVEGEKELLTVIEEKLSADAERAREDLSSKGKMMFSCSVLAGLALVIFII